jgi:uncharacterized protein involved in exopolysaccharide biosynthesis
MNKNERTTPIDLFILLAQKKKYYFFNFVLVGLLSTVIALSLPKWFQAETKILPPSKDLGFLGGFSQIFSNLPMTRALGIKGMSEEEGICISILNSRTLSEVIIRKHNLTIQYKKPDIEKTIKVFQERLKYFNDEEGSIVIRFTDNNPMRSSEITNDIVKILDSLYVSLNLDRTSRNRIVVEKRLFQNRADMEKVETELANFQKKYNIVSLEEQTKATVEVMSQLQAKLYQCNLS